MSKKSKGFTYEGTLYKSAKECGVALVAGGMRCCDAAKAVGVTSQTVYSGTPEGKANVLKNKAIRRVKELGTKGTYSLAEISKKTGLSIPKIQAMLKKNNIPIVTGAMKAQMEMVKEAAKAAKIAEKNAAKPVKAPKVPKEKPVKAPKAPKAPKAKAVKVDAPAVTEDAPVVPTATVDVSEINPDTASVEEMKAAVEAMSA